MPTNTLDDRVGLVVYRDIGGIDAIAEHSRHLVAALCDQGVRARYADVGLGPMRHESERPAWILLQYNPLSYGRWGFAPGLVGDAIAVRRRTGARLAILVHEPWVDVRDWRSAIMSGYQRVQLRALLAIADRVLATTESLANVLGGDVAHTPVGANITPRPSTAEQAREHLGLGDHLVISLFGRAHPSRALEYAEVAVARLAAATGLTRLVVLNLGDLAPRLALPPDVEVRNTGRMQPVELSLALRASDMLLLPFSDGLSTRRTTLMAGLAHGVPVVGLRGRSTDRVLCDRPESLVLTPVGDPAAFADEVVELAHDRPRLRAQGEAGRRLYLDEFDWNVVARRVHAAITGPP